MRTVGLFGGTFDPIHRGHVQSALELQRRLQLDEMRLLPCHLPPHRESPGCDSERRLTMVQLACAGTPLQVDDRELRRSGPSYSVETLEQIRAELGDAVSLSWIMGTDAFCGLDRWHRWRELLDLAHIIVIARPGESLPESGPVAELLARHRAADVTVLSREPGGRIVTLALTPYPISATAIREKLANGDTVDDVLPADVVDYIATHQLYR